MLLNVAFSELKMKKGKVVLTNRGSILHNVTFSGLKMKNGKVVMTNGGSIILHSLKGYLLL